MLNFYPPKSCLALVIFLGLFTLSVYAEPVATGSKSATALSLLEQYRSVTRQVETMKIYNQYLQNLLQSQAEEKVSLEQQLKDIEVTKQEILPMALKMLDSLDKFIAMDVPFLPEERKQRLTQLKETMVKADVTDAEKFRRLMEAFQIENEYGNTLETYKGTLTLNGITSSVNFLRLGRVGLFYQRLDGSESGFWNKEESRWESLINNGYAADIRKGLRIARKETAPDLLVLPIPAAEAAK